MKILGIETTGPYCSVVLRENEDIIGKEETDEVFNHLRSLTPMIKKIMEDTGNSMEDVDTIAVSAGPGSFTGIRIGVSTARALDQATGKGIVKVPSLDAFGIYGIGDTVCTETVKCPLINARRNQVYGGAYVGEEAIVPGGPYMLQELLDKLPKDRDVLFGGDGCIAYRDQMEEFIAGSRGCKMAEVHQSAEAVSRWTYENLKNGKTRPVTYEELMPDYMRMAEAQRKLEEKRRAQRG